MITDHTRRPGAAIESIEAEGASRDRTVLMRFMDAADRAFQGSGSILPDFLRLGDCKAEGIVKLAEAYRALLLAYDQRHDEPQPAAGPGPTSSGYYVCRCVHCRLDFGSSNKRAAVCEKCKRPQRR